MERLTAFAGKWTMNVPGAAGCWLGDISGVRVSKRVVEIARRAGFDPASDLELPQISDVTASRVIAYGMRYSLAYADPRYRVTEAKEYLEMLRELGPHANFWADQLYKEFADAQPVQGVKFSRRITRCTFEVGVIAANETTGFIWWRGEED